MRNVHAALVYVTAVLMCAVGIAQAQEKDQSSSESGTTVAENGQKPQIKHIQPYRLDFALNELQDGKKTNTRRYSINLTAGSGDEIKIGTRVPVRTGPKESGTQFQYMDVGTNIWAFLREVGEEIQLEVKGEVSDLDKQPSTDLGPIVRQMKISGSTLLVTGKPILIGSMDDPNSTRQFQLEVIATKLR
ncbi:MAG TPA: hypothetical protein VFA85_04365 [Terriglobales bacterium]|nr:hypothetical protein [Terriglobales bacterium]